MKLGIKVGLKGDSKEDLEHIKPDFCEFWFNAGKIPQYDPLLNFCRRQKIGIGLHFWGATRDSTLSNIAYPDSSILTESRQLIKRTIDVAARSKALYVNIHPAGSILTKVDFEREQFTPFGTSAIAEKSLVLLKESLILLGQYARERGIILTVESVARFALGNPWSGTEGRLKPTNIGEFPITEIEQIMPIENVFFANDFGHTAASILSQDRTHIKTELINIARRLAPATKLLHVSYIIPPYNGTDYHGCLYYDEVKSPDAIPNYEELKQLLKLFINRSDVCALVEPEKDHVGNFRVLKKLIQEINK